MTVLITLTIAGSDSGPFDLYSSTDGFTTPFETNIDKSLLVAGYESSLVPDYANTVRVKSTGDCTNYVDIFVEQPLTTSTTTTIISCGSEIDYGGAFAYPTTNIVSLGSGTGTVEFVYDAYSVPDRFILIYDGDFIIDTGYRGDSSYDYGQPGRTSFTSALTGREDPITGNTYPDIDNYPDDGYPRIVGPGSGSDSFDKLNSTPVNITVSVYAPMDGTAWVYSVGCPNGSTTTTTSSSSTSSTTTTTTTLATLSYCYQGRWEVDDPTHPLGGQIEYINEYGESVYLSGIWFGETITFNASSIVYAYGVDSCLL